MPPLPPAELRAEVRTELWDAIMMVRGGPRQRQDPLTVSEADFPEWAKDWQALRVVLVKPGLRAALDRLAPGGRDRRETLALLRRCADGATLDEIVTALRRMHDRYEGAVRVRDVLSAALVDELLEAAEVPDPGSTGGDPRLRFDDATHTATLDGRAVRVPNPAAYAAFKAIATAGGRVVPASDLNGLPGLRHKRIDRLLADLPATLRKCVKSKPSLGRWLSLPPVKNRP
jgi:hypothetical protein